MNPQVGATIGVVGFVIGTLAVSHGVGSRFRWLFPAAVSVGFFALTLYPIIREGPLGFLSELTRTLWASQIWFDLILALGVGYTALASRARAVGMNILPWILTIAGTGSIGLCAMYARILQLEQSQKR
jgi:hypothetical protein